MIDAYSKFADMMRIAFKNCETKKEIDYKLNLVVKELTYMAEHEMFEREIEQNLKRDKIIVDNYLKYKK